MLLPGILTFEGIPHSLRVVGVMPVAFIFAGLGGWKIYQFLKENIMTEKKKKLLLVASFLFLFAISFADFNKYFFIWGKNKETEIGQAEYGLPFTAALQKGNIFATQFHPEKSGDLGLKMLENFVKYITLHPSPLPLP